MNSVKNLILFDIDHTLFSTEGMSRRIWSHLLGTSALDLDVAGKTDHWIVNQLAPNSNKEEILKEYEFLLCRSLLESPPMVPLPGVLGVLQWLQSVPGVRLGVQTGNMYWPARMKLLSAGLNVFFDGFGGYSDEANEYNEEHEGDFGKLGCVTAPMLVQSIFGNSGDNNSFRTIVIGDSLGDMEAGRSAGALTIGVATGKTKGAELSAKTDHVVENMHQAYHVFEKLLGVTDCW